MVVTRGLDRVDGTHVDGGMGDDLWSAHTAEIRKLFEASFVDGAPPRGFKDFCEDYATGCSTTASMRTVLARIASEARERIHNAYSKRHEFD